MSITEGLHFDLPNEEYHALTDWLSSTQLKRALPEYTDPDDDAALRFGSLVHKIVLEPDRMDESYVMLDPKKVGTNKDGSESSNPLNTLAWKNALSEAADAGLEVVSAADWDRAHRMADSVRDHKDAYELLHASEGEFEESAFWTDENGIQHKARFDKRIPGAIVDLKTISARLTDEKLTEAIWNYHYHLSVAHYLTVARGLELDAERFWLVFVSKQSPHHVRVIDLTDDYLAIGLERRAEAIDLIVNGQRGRTTLAPPRWAYRPAPAATGIPSDFTWSIHDYA